MQDQSHRRREDATYHTSIGSVTGQVHSGSGDIHVGGFIAGGPVSNRTDLIDALREFALEVDRSRQYGLANDIVDDVVTEIHAAKREAEKDHPEVNRLLSRLNNAKELLNAGSGTIQAASGAVSTVSKLLPALQRWILHIPSLFGG